MPKSEAGARNRSASERQERYLELHDRKDQREWEQRYKFHSNWRMKASYKVAKSALHDPFNKDPSWNEGVISKLGRASHKDGTPLKKIAVERLDRVGLRQWLLSVMPGLTDPEITQVFNFLDADNSGEVDSDELNAALKRARSATVAQGWRNPLHRMPRMPPARVDGRNHSTDKDDIDWKLSERKNLAESELLRSLAVETPRPLTSGRRQSKYLYFAGGGDADRFRRHAWREQANQAKTVSIPDPGPFVQPGWHTTLGSRTQR